MMMMEVSACTCLILLGSAQNRHAFAGNGCFLDYGQFQTYQQGLISPGASNWTVDITLRSAQVQSRTNA